MRSSWDRMALLSYAVLTRPLRTHFEEFVTRAIPKAWHHVGKVIPSISAFDSLRNQRAAIARSRSSRCCDVFRPASVSVQRHRSSSVEHLRRCARTRRSAIVRILLSHEPHEMAGSLNRSFSYLFRRGHDSPAGVAAGIPYPSAHFYSIWRLETEGGGRCECADQWMGSSDVALLPR